MIAQHLPFAARLRGRSNMPGTDGQVASGSMPGIQGLSGEHGWASHQWRHSCPQMPDMVPLVACPPVPSTLRLATACSRAIALILICLCLFAAPLAAQSFDPPYAPPGESRLPTESQPSQVATGLPPAGELPSAPPNVSPGEPVPTSPVATDFAAEADRWLSPQSLPGTLRLLGLVTVMSLAPAILLMTTSFVRIFVVLNLLRQALGTPQLPPNQVLVSLSLFMTALLMYPVWHQAYVDGIAPYSEQRIGLAEASQAVLRPVRRFMSLQIERTGNQADIWLFMRHLPTSVEPATYDDVPLVALLPAYVLSELKTAFLIGFQLYLPFLILDLVVASVSISMGMYMLPPAVVSFPLKLLLFVMVDGWRLVVGMLLESFVPFG